MSQRGSATDAGAQLQNHNEKLKTRRDISRDAAFAVLLGVIGGLIGSFFWSGSYGPFWGVLCGILIGGCLAILWSGRPSSPAHSPEAGSQAALAERIEAMSRRNIAAAVAFFALVAVIAIASLAAWTAPQPEHLYWHSLGGYLMITLAATTFGSLIGFLFAVPRSSVRPPQPKSDADGDDPATDRNDNTTQSQTQAQPIPQQAGAAAVNQTAVQGTPMVRPGDSAAPPPAQAQLAAQPGPAPDAAAPSKAGPDSANPAAGSAAKGVIKAASSNARRLGINSNLDDVSDWLTKTLIGAGLTQVTAVPGLLSKIGEHYKDKPESIVIAAAIVFGVGSGFLAGYIFTRLAIARAFQIELQADEAL